MNKLTITHKQMTSTATRHTATKVNTDAPAWRVSWLDRDLTYNQAITAMTLAEIVATADLSNTTTLAVIDSLADELDVTGASAISEITGPGEAT